MWCVCGATEHFCQSNVATMQLLSTGGLCRGQPHPPAVWGAVASVCPASAPWACGTATRGRLLSAIVPPGALGFAGSQVADHLLFCCCSALDPTHRLKSLQHHFKKKRTQPEPSSPSLTADEDVLHSPKHASTDEEEYESRPKRRSVSIDVARLPPTGPPSVCDRRPSLEQWHEARRARWVAGWQWVWRAGMRDPHAGPEPIAGMSLGGLGSSSSTTTSSTSSRKGLLHDQSPQAVLCFLLFLSAAGTRWKARGPQPRTG